MQKFVFRITARWWRDGGEKIKCEEISNGKTGVGFRRAKYRKNTKFSVKNVGNKGKFFKILGGTKTIFSGES